MTGSCNLNRKLSIVGVLKKNPTCFGLRDIHILLFLANENFTDNKLFQTCRQGTENFDSPKTFN